MVSVVVCPLVRVPPAKATVVIMPSIRVKPLVAKVDEFKWSLARATKEWEVTSLLPPVKRWIITRGVWCPFKVVIPIYVPVVG